MCRKVTNKLLVMKVSMKNILLIVLIIQIGTGCFIITDIFNILFKKFDHFFHYVDPNTIVDLQHLPPENKKISARKDFSRRVVFSRIEL